MFVGRHDDADRVAGLPQFRHGGKAPAVELGADLGCAGIAGLEDARQLGAGQRGVDAGMVLAEGSDPDDPAFDLGLSHGDERSGRNPYGHSKDLLLF